MDLVKNADLSKLSTLRVQAQAEYFSAPNSLDELIDLFSEIKSQGLAWNILGAGSNTLLSSRAIAGVLISTNNMDTVTKISDTSYEFGAGLRMPKLCALMSKESLAGAEFMEGIPGSVAGGIVMNAGAHGSEISDILISAKLLNLETLEIEEKSNTELGLSYRRSNIDPQKYFIVSAVFEFNPGDKEEIRQRVVANNRARTGSQPIKSWTCGCTFKNPLSDYGAGQLIDDLGLKGFELGDFVISNQHGNFFENQGQGTSMDFCNLMQHVINVAKEVKGIDLKPEVKPMGEFSEEELKIWS